MRQQLGAFWDRIAEGKQRKPSPRVTLFMRVASVAIVFYYFYTAVFTAPFDILFRGEHTAIFLCIVFILYSPWREGDKGVTPVDLILCLLAISTAVWLHLDSERILFRWAFSDEVFPLDVFFGGMLILLILEATRRVMGWVLTWIVLGLVVYTVAGPLIPGLFGHRGATVAEMIEVNYLTTSGIFGIPAKVSSILAFPFIVFGAFLKFTGAADFFFDLAVRAVGNSRGGIAKTAVIGSAFFGMLSGSAIANCASIGTITIPLMIRAGYPAIFAAAVETAASAGGVIMPPMMGAVAFVMAEVLGITYFDVIKIAFIPACIYFFCVFVQVDSEAIRLKLKGYEGRTPDPTPVLLMNLANFVIPLVWMVMRLYQNLTPARVAMEVIIVLMVLTFIRKRGKINWLEVVDAFVGAVKANIIVAVACASAGILIGLMALTGLGLKFSTLIMALGGNNTFFALLIIMFLALFLGLALDITPTYILTAALAGPAMVKLGLPVVPAHLFMVWFSAMATVSPPVCLTAFTAATIAKSDPMKTGWRGWRMALAGFIVPFAFLYHPPLVDYRDPLPTVWAVFVTGLAAYSIVGGADGFLLGRLLWPVRVLLMALGVMLISPYLEANVIAVVVFAVVFVLARLKERREKALEAALSAGTSAAGV